MSHDPVIEALDRELAEQAVQAQRAIAAEQARTAELESELERAGAWNRQLRAELDHANAELRLLHRLPIDLPRLFERRFMRALMALVQRLRLLRRGSA